MNKVKEGKLFQILKDDAVKVLHSICQQIWRTQQWSQDWERSVLIPISKGKQCQRMFKLLDNCTHFTCQQDYAQNPSGQASAVYELRTSRCSSWIQKRQRNRRSNCQHQLDHSKGKRLLLIQKNIYFCFIEYAKPFDCVLVVKVAQSCPTLCDPMDYTAHGIPQARILEWVACPFSSGSSQPRNQTQVSCIAGEFFTS